MDNNKFDYLLKEITKKLTLKYLDILRSYPEFNEEVDTSPLLNMTLGVFVGSLVNILDKIEENTIGEEKLIKNIHLTKNSIMKSIEELPFMIKVEFVN